MAEVAVPNHQPLASKKDPGLFWEAATYNEAYWDAYIAARPKYSDDFYDRVIQYYKSHNPSPPETSIAHDVGTGPGQVAAKLAQYFNHIHASDANETHIAVAATRNEKLGVNSQISWTKLAAEQLKAHYPAGSASFVSAAECLPLLDVPVAMETFAHLLAPNGTLAVWFYGRPCFSEPEVASKCQPILNDIIDLTFEKVIKSSNEAQKATWKRSTDTLYSFLDNVAFSSDTWQDVYRHKWNPHLPLSVVGPNACNYAIEPSSEINEETERVVTEQDPHFWEEQWNVDEVRRFVEALLPNIEQLKAQGVYDHVEVKYNELEKAMGGRSQKRAITWPVVLILATRR